jgi:spoIIIJ-associated protein
MADSEYEYTGKSVDEAVAEGLSKLGLSQNQVEIEVLSRGSRGIFGLGSEPARVRLTPRSGRSAGVPAAAAPVELPAAAEPPPGPARTPNLSAMDAMDEMAPDADMLAPAAAPAAPVADEEMASMAVEILNGIVSRMGFDAKVIASWHEPDAHDGDRYLLLDLHGHELSPLIGRRGETLASLQYLVRLIVNQRIKQWKNIVVDVEHYKERRVAQLTQLALRMADQVAQSGRAVSLEPMPPNERRIVHLALRDHPTVYTQSSGEGDRRKVHIVAKS